MRPSVNRAEFLSQSEEGGSFLSITLPTLQHDDIDLRRASAWPGEAVAHADLLYGFLVCHSCKETRNSNDPIHPHVVEFIPPNGSGWL